MQARACGDKQSKVAGVTTNRGCLKLPQWNFRVLISRSAHYGPGMRKLRAGSKREKIKQDGVGENSEEFGDCSQQPHPAARKRHWPHPCSLRTLITPFKIRKSS